MQSLPLEMTGCVEKVSIMIMYIKSSLKSSISAVNFLVCGERVYVLIF